MRKLFYKLVLNALIASTMEVYVAIAERQIPKAAKIPQGMLETLHFFSDDKILNIDGYA